MRVRTVVVFLTGLMAYLLAGPNAGQADQVHLNLVLALDASASVNDQEFETQRAGVAFALLDADVVAAIEGAPGGINVIITQWSSIKQQAIVIPWTWLGDGADARALSQKVVAMPRRLGGGNTMIHGGLEHAGEMLAAAPAPAVREVIDITANGWADDIGKAEAARDRLVEAGIVINGLAIEEDPVNVTLHLHRSIIGGAGSFVITAESFLDFARAMRLKLLREIGQPIAMRPQ